jgi:hypothetical protein
LALGFDVLDNRISPAIIAPVSGTFIDQLSLDVSGAAAGFQVSGPSAVQSGSLAATAISLHDASSSAPATLDTLSVQGAGITDTFLGIPAGSGSISAQGALTVDGITGQSGPELSTTFQFGYTLSGTSTNSLPINPIAASLAITGQNLQFQVQSNPADGFVPGAAVEIDFNSVSALGNQSLPGGALSFTSTVTSGGVTVPVQNNGGTSNSGSFLTTVGSTFAMEWTANLSASGPVPTGPFNLAGVGFTLSFSAKLNTPTTHFGITAPSAAKAGSPVSFTVTALDESNNPTSANYAGTVHFSSTDGTALLPLDTSLLNGTGIFSAMFLSPGVQTITAADSASAGVSGTSSLITVTTMATQLAVTAPAAVSAGDAFIVTVAAEDGSGHIATDYSGIVQLSSTDNQAVLPASAPLVNGVGAFLVTLKSVAAGPWTVKAQDTALSNVAGVSSAITVNPAPASYMTVSTPANATTGSPVHITVGAYDRFGNIAAGYTGTVKLTSTDPAEANLGSYTFTSGTGKDNGVHTFNITLKTAGSQTITATDTTSTNPTVTGTSSPIATRGLVVTGLTPTATGFSVNFNEPFTVSDVNLYGGSQASPVQDVTLIGASSGPVNGSFVVDPSGTSATFKASSIFLSTFFHSCVLPDDTWTVTLLSGTGTGATAHGFFDALNAPLDGGNNAGHDNYTTSFTTANSSKEVLSIPDFARGPDGANTIKVPNDSAKGIPVILANVPTASGVTDVVFTLTYNPTLLTPIGAGTGDSSGAGSTFVMDTAVAIDAAHSTAAFTWHNGAAQNGAVVLGDIFAKVPNSAANAYKGKEILGLSQIKVNNADFTGAWANGLHVNAYFGDVTGDGKISGLDVATAGAVASGGSLGLSAYRLVDPALVGDIAGDASIDATAVSDLASYTSNLPTPPIPLIPAGLTIAPGGPDPTLSLGVAQRQGDAEKGRQGETTSSPGLFVSLSPGLVVTVPVMLDDPHPAGSTGMEEAVLALTYDPKVLTVSSLDITLGSIPDLSSGWHLVSVVDQATGQVGIDLYSTTAITLAQAGSLVKINFHLMPGLAVPATAVQLVSAVTPNGRSFSTEVADDQGQYVISMGRDRLVIETDIRITRLPTPRFGRSLPFAGCFRFGQGVGCSTIEKTVSTIGARRAGMLPR